MRRLTLDPQLLAAGVLTRGLARSLLVAAAYTRRVAALPTLDPADPGTHELRARLARVVEATGGRVPRVKLVVSRAVLDGLRDLVGDEPLAPPPLDPRTPIEPLATILALADEVDEFEPALVPRYAGDRAGDMVVHTALRGRATIVSDDPALAHRGGFTSDRFRGRIADSVTLRELTRLLALDGCELAALRPGLLATLLPVQRTSMASPNE